jgi:hypothetical protein
MDYEQRMRLKTRLQRLGQPALLEEVIRLGEEMDLLAARLTTLESGSARRIARGTGCEMRNAAGPCSGLGGYDCRADDELHG